MYTKCFRVNKSIIHPSSKSVVNLNISAVTYHYLETTKLLLRSIDSFVLLTSKSTWKYTKSLSHVVCFHIINPYTQFAGRVLFHRALYASSRGSVSHACRLPQHLLPLIGQHPETTLSPLSLTDVNLLDQIPCCSHIWGYWGSLRKFGPQETQPRKQKDNAVLCSAVCS